MIHLGVTGGESAEIEFRVLGPVEAVRNGDLLPLGGPRQRALLALLLIEAGKPVSADRLVDALWHGWPPPGAASTLPSYVSRLRAALAPEVTLTSVAAGYALDTDRAEVDFIRFQRLVAAGREALARGAIARAVERLRAALALWRGQAFAGVGEVPRLAEERQRLEELRLLALEARIEGELQLGASEELIEELEVLVAEEPYRERLWQQLILALYRAGRQADALAAYQRTRAVLDDQLGIEPGEELKALERAILRHEVPSARPPEERHNLRAPVTSFIGRKAELRDVERLLGEARLVTLTGVGGVGKTRLALEAARRALLDFPGGVYFVDFSVLSDPELVLGHVAATLHVREHGDTEIGESLVARLHDEELLLVFDNCEHVRGVCAELAHRLLSGAPKLRVLATSREVLGAPGEVDFQVPPLELAEAVELLLARARAARAGLSGDERTLTSAGRICEVLDGLPLALELAAVRAKALSLEEIASRLSDRFRFLVSWRRLAAARHRTLQEAMDWSYELLSEDERALFDSLSVFAGGFTLEAAAAVCVGGNGDQALELIERLVDASLVVADERDGATRYRLLETVRQYAAQRLEERHATKQTRTAHVRYFRELAGAAALRGPEQSLWLERLDAELENLRSAIETAAVVGDTESELRLVGALGRYWWIRGLLTEGRARTDAALARGSQMPPSLRANPLHRAAGLAWAQADHRRARSLAAQALEAAHAAGDVFAELSAHNVIGIAAIGDEDYTTARQHLLESLRLAEQHGLEDDVRAAQTNLGTVALYSGDAWGAISIFEELLAGARERNDREGMGFPLLHLGLAAYQIGNDSGARAAWEEARRVFGTMRFPQHVGHSLQGLAALEARAGNYASAARLLGCGDAAFADAGALANDPFRSRVAVYAESEARGHLGEEAFAAAYEKGKELGATSL